MGWGKTLGGLVLCATAPIFLPALAVTGAAAIASAGTVVKTSVTNFAESFVDNVFRNRVQD